MASFPALQSLSRRLALGAPLIAAALAATVARADAWIDTHDEPTALWELDTSAGAKLLARQRVRLPAGGEGRDDGAERIGYSAPPGTTAWLWRPIPEAAVIEELRVEVDVQSPHPAVLVGVDVALPRGIGEARSGTETLRLRSDPAGNSAGGVLRLSLEDLPQRLQREARAWRLAHRGEPLDTRGAYVTRIGVGLPGLGRPSEAWVRETRVVGLVTPMGRVESGVASRPSSDSAPESPPAVGGTIKKSVVTLRSDGFRIDGELFFPRILRWHGEPLATLAERGVNTLWLDEAPTPQLAAEAAHHRLRLFCPPPESAEAAATTPPSDRVLAWVLRGEQTRRTLDPALAAVEFARGLDPEWQRPVLAHVIDGVAEWSRVADGLVIAPAQSSQAPPGTPLLGAVRLDLDPLASAQLDALIGDGLASLWLPPSDISLQVESALTTGAVGVAFYASERLDETDEATRAAAGWVEAINRRLKLLEPWLAGPRSTTRLAPGEVGAVFNRGGVRLVTFAPLDPDAAAGPRLLQGVDEGAQTYRLSPAGVAPWPVERVSGGVSAAALGPSAPGDLLVCNDPRVLRSLQTYLQPTMAAAATRLAEVAQLRLKLTDAVDEDQRRRATALLAESRLALARRAYPAAYDAAYAALLVTSAAEVQRREIAQQGPWLGSTPLTLLPCTLTDAFHMTQVLDASHRGSNRLHGGSFEDIDGLRRVGWRHPQASREATDSAKVELVASSEVHGQRALRLRGDGAHEGSRIESPAIELKRGETVEVTGWARVEAAPGTGALVVSDTLGGASLALRISDTGGQWRPFHLLRAAGADTTTTVQFSTEGAVVGDIDGVMVRSVEPLGVASRPATSGAGLTERR